MYTNPYNIHTGWWFGTFLFSHILGRIIPSDFDIFQRGRSTTNQIYTYILYIYTVYIYTVDIYIYTVYIYILYIYIYTVYIYTSMNWLCLMDAG